MLRNKTCPVEMQGYEKTRKNLWIQVINKPERQYQCFLQLITGQKHCYALQTVHSIIELNIAVRKRLFLYYLCIIFCRQSCSVPPRSLSWCSCLAGAQTGLSARLCPQQRIRAPIRATHLGHSWCGYCTGRAASRLLRGWADTLENTGKLGTPGMLQFPPGQEVATFLYHLSNHEDLIDIFGQCPKKKNGNRLSSNSLERKIGQIWI